MTPKEIQAAREWAALKCGGKKHGPYWYFIKSPIDSFNTIISKNDWQPDNPDTGQIWMLVEKMSELGQELWLIRTSGKKTAATFCRYETMEEAHAILNNVHQWVWEVNPCHAIIKAAMATEVNNDS